LNILVVGGAGYIGSHRVKTLVEAGHVTTVFDSLVTGHRDAVHLAAEFVSGDISDRPLIDWLLARNFDGSLGEGHDPETHLIPLALQAAARKRPAIEIYGDDYDTPDGTCIRDHVHLDDLCAAHLLALDHLVTGGKSTAFSLSNGQGFSVREVIATAERITGRNVPCHTGRRRPGGPPRLVADASRAISKLGWRPQRADLETIMVRYYGRYSSRARGAEHERPEIDERDTEAPSPGRQAAKEAWAKLIRRVYEVDPLQCPRCGAQMSVIALIQDPAVIERILTWLGLREPPQHVGPSPPANPPSLPLTYDALPDIA